ncbi:hypothetical protein CLPU_12c00690 [Gottschalkia purinilytica]|uniref:Uncharacterized protein n=1 Tax=Gottschalkia purinilytica TaxID=1503 RepID=A0A0L0W8M3_GOTPU|nr:hypothetical protein [Gottschalkia purinilytica]KNF07796.1 hypothetical protein CLPU_12c00690 [Gottschalkia purinilytica]
MSYRKKNTLYRFLIFIGVAVILAIFIGFDNDNVDNESKRNTIGLEKKTFNLQKIKI